MSHSLMLNQHRVLTSEKLGDTLRVFQRSEWVDLFMEQLINYRRARNLMRGGLTVFPMTKTRPLKVLRLKVGKASTERTGHLGIVALIATIPISKYTRESEESVSRTLGSRWHRLESLVNPKIFKSDKD